MNKQIPINIESRAFVLFFMLLIECKKSSNTQTLAKNISDLRKKITDTNIRSTTFLKPLKAKAKDEFKFCYAKLNTDIQANNFSSVQLKGNNLTKITSLYSTIFLSKYPNEKIIKDGINSFIEHLESLFKTETEKSAKESLSQNITVSEFKTKLSNTQWFFYHHDYESDTPLTEITRLVLEFKDLSKTGNNTHLHEKKTISDFEGDAEITSEKSTHTNIILNLKRTKGNQKDLQIRFALTDGIEDDSIFIGQYIDFEKGETIITGTFVLENTKGHFKRHSVEDEQKNKIETDRQVLTNNLLIVKRALVYDSGWEYYIPKEVASYLENKWMNFTKAKTNISSLPELGKFLAKQEKKLFLNSKFNTFINYDIFIVTPVGSISKEEREEMSKEIGNAFFDSAEINGTTDEEVNTQCFKAEKSLTDMLGIKKIYYPPRHYKIDNPNINEELDPNEILKTDLLAMRQSRFVILIMPKLLCTSALVKVGWAIQMEKPIFIFQTEKNSLPKLLTEDYKKIIKVLTKPKKISQIPNYLKVNCKEFFKFE